MHFFFILHPSAAQCSSFSYYTRRAIIIYCIYLWLHSGTGWFKHKTPNSFRCQCPRRFWETLKFCTCLMCPCRDLNDFFFPPDIRVLVFWGGYLLRDPIFSPEKKKKNIRKRFGRGTLYTCAKISGSNFQKRRGHLEFCAVKCKNHGLAS